MSVEQQLVAVCVAVGVVLALVVSLSWTQVAGLRREIAALRGEIDASRAAPGSGGSARQGARSAGDAPAVTVPETTFVITDVGAQQSEATPDVPTRIEGRLFADIVARETVVKVGGIAHGLRRAASPEVRNRIGFEMRREVRRARRQRRADLKEAMRDLRRRQRDEVQPMTGDARPTGTRSGDGTAA
jgi:hypothetical protein